MKAPPRRLEATLCDKKPVKKSLQTIVNALLVTGSIASIDNVNIPVKSEHHYNYLLLCNTQSDDKYFTYTPSSLTAISK